MDSKKPVIVLVIIYKNYAKTYDTYFVLLITRTKQKNQRIYNRHTTYARKWERLKWPTQYHQEF